MVVDAGCDWEPGAGDDAIQEYLDQNWDDHKGEARLISSDLVEVSFQDVSGFDPSKVGVRQMFTYKAICTAMQDYSTTWPKPREVKAGEKWTMWPNAMGRLCREGDPLLYIVLRDTRLKINNKIEEQHREHLLNNRDAKRRGESPRVSVEFEMVPAPEPIRFETATAEVG